MYLLHVYMILCLWLLCLCKAQVMSTPFKQEQQMPKKIKEIHSEYLKKGPGSKYLQNGKAIASHPSLSIRISWEDYNWNNNYSIRIYEWNQPWRSWQYETSETNITIYDFSPCTEVSIYVESPLNNDYCYINRIQSDSDDLRLENNYYNSGRLAYRTYYGWTPGVCGYRVPTETANVVCKTICGTRHGRFYGSILRAPKHFWGEPLEYAVMYLGCRGDENSIQNCNQYIPNGYNISYESCSVKETVGIQCFKEQSGYGQVNEFLNPDIKYEASCKINEFFVTFSKKENLYNEITSFVTNDPYCPSIIIENNYENYTIRIPFSGCKTSFDGTVYSQDLTATLSYIGGYPTVSYTRDYRILILCHGETLSIDQSFKVDRNPIWETQIPTLIMNGSNIISMRAYSDITLNNPLYVPPVFQLGTALYIKITTNTSLDRVLFISSCEAFPASYSYDKRIIISDGCSNEEGVAIIGAHENNYAAFRMQTFRFTNWPDEPIILNCTIQLSHQNSSNNIIYKSCYKTQHPFVNSIFPSSTTEEVETTTYWPSDEGDETTPEFPLETTPPIDDTTPDSKKQQESLAGEQISMHDEERDSHQNSRYRRSVDSEHEDELHSPIPLNNFKIVILGPRVPDNLLKKYSQENKTFDFHAGNGAEYTVHNGLIFLKSLPKIANITNASSVGEQNLQLKLLKLINEKQQLKTEELFQQNLRLKLMKENQQRKTEELLLVGALALCLCFGIIMTCLLFLRRMNQSIRSEYQPLNSKADDA
jgi:hypothetical protein